MPDTFELFPPNGCNERLPLNPIKDQYTIVRIAPLEAVVNNRPAGPVVIPRDVVYPRLIDDIRRHFPEFPYNAFAKGGPTLIDKWTGVIDPPPELVPAPTVTTIPVGEVHDFLANPRLEIEGEEVEVDLSPDQVEGLLDKGVTLVEIGQGRDASLVRVTARGGTEPEPAEREERARPIEDLFEFLSDPKVDLETRRAPVRLTPKNVKELTTVGVSRVDVLTSDGHETVYVRTGPSMTAAPMIRAPEVLAPSTALEHGHYERTYEASAYMVEPPTAPSLGYPQPQPLSIGPGYHHHVGLGELITRTKSGTIPQLKANPALVETIVDQSVLPRFELLLYLPYRQTWELQGYSRGELLNTISLAPEEETTIEVFTWDRIKRLREEGFTLEREGTLDVGFTDKMSMETLKEMGTTSDWGFNINGDVEVPLEYVTVGVGGGYDTQNSIKELHRGTQQVVSEAVRKASSRIKSTRQSKVTESEEIGRETKVARKIKNPNKCHTLDLDYFEILATYKVATTPDLAEAKICVLTPMPITDPIDRNFLLFYEGELRSMLLSSTFSPGFDAARKLSAWDKVCAIRCKEPCPCEQPKPTPPPASSAPAPAPQAQPTQPPVADPTKAARDAVAQAARNVRSKIKALQQASIDTPSHAKGGAHTPAASLCDLANDVFGSHPESEWSVAKERYRMWLYRKVVLETHASRFWAAAERFASSNAETPEALDEFIKTADVQVIDALNLVVLGLTYKLKALEIVGTLIKGLCNPLPFLSNVGFDDGGFDAAFKQAADAVKAYKQALITATPAAAPAASTVTPEEKKREEIKEVVQEFAPPEYEVKEIAEAKVAEEALLAHVRHNESYYRQGIWAKLDPSDRQVFLSFLGDLTQHVHNEVVAFVGKKAALPLRVDRHPEAKKWFEDNVIKNTGFADNPAPFSVTLPTKGVALESRLGRCDTCEEFIANHRDLDLRMKTAEVKAAEARAVQEGLETDRYTKRLEQDPPVLDDPDPHQGQDAIRLVIRQEKDS